MPILVLLEQFEQLVCYADGLDQSPCQNGGSCIDAVNGYKCDCKDGYIGDNCQTGMCWIDWNKYAFTVFFYIKINLV